MTKKPQILTTTILAESKLFTIEGLELRFSNGVERHYERIRGHGKGSVMIIPLLDKDTMLLIREYAVGTEGYVLGFAKGAIAQHEELFATANRELMEEVGYRAEHLTAIGRVSASPGYMVSMMEIILAEGLTAETLPGDEPEPIEVMPWSLNNINELLEHPEFHEARSIAALLLLERKLNRVT